MMRLRHDVGTELEKRLARAEGSPLLSVPLPIRWLAVLRPHLETARGIHSLQVTSLPTPVAFGAPNRVPVVFDVDAARMKFAVHGALLLGQLVSLDDILELPWGAYWIGSLLEAIDGEVRRRGVTRRIVPPSRPPAGFGSPSGDE